MDEVLKGRSGPKHDTIARGNYARCEMGNSSGRDVWTPTSNSESLNSYNTARLERAAGWAQGLAILIKTEGEN